MEKKKIYVTAHAGCMNTKMDSLESIIAGINAGANIVEVDIRFMNNCIPILSHDKLKIRKHIIRLEEALKIVKEFNNIKINLDIKEIEGIIYLKELLYKTGMNNRVFLTGISYDLVGQVLEKPIDIPYFLNIDPNLFNRTNKDYIIEQIKMINNMDVLGINIDYHFVTPKLVEDIHNINKKLSVWTVDNFDDIYRMIEYGVDNITTNKVDMVAEILKEKNLYLDSNSTQE
jgi:glycerophosphoryl diester phosphodiesterase